MICLLVLLEVTRVLSAWKGNLTENPGNFAGKEEKQRKANRLRYKKIENVKTGQENVSR